MSHSNRGLNEPFYKWIDDVRRAMRKEKELQEKLEFYNMKLIGYKGVSYDRIGSSGSRSSGDSELLYWLDKIADIEHKICQYNSYLAEFNVFILRLGERERMILISKINNTGISSLSIKCDTKTISKIARCWTDWTKTYQLKQT